MPNTENYGIRIQYQLEEILPPLLFLHHWSSANLESWYKPFLPRTNRPKHGGIYARYTPPTWLQP